MRIAAEIILVDEVGVADEAGSLQVRRREIGAARQYRIVGCQ